MALFTICNINIWCHQNVSVKCQLKIAPRSFIIACRAKMHRFLYVPLNANELLLPASVQKMADPLDKL